MRTGTIRYIVSTTFHITAPVLDDQDALERRMTEELRARATADGWNVPEGQLTSFRLDWRPEGSIDRVRVVAETVIHP